LRRYAALLLRVRPRTLAVCPSPAMVDSIADCAPVATGQTTHQIELVVSLTVLGTLLAFEDIITGRHSVIERAVVVFAPLPHLHNHFRLNVLLSERNSHQPDSAWERSRMYDALSILCRITTGTVTLIITSCFDRDWLGCPPDISTSDHFESELRRTIDGAISSDPAEEPSSASAQGRLEFMGMKESLGSRQVGAWLE
jgi:hypothetical protein